MTAAAAFRGQPLLVLIGLLGAWLALRVVVWQPSASAELRVPFGIEALAPHQPVAGPASAEQHDAGPAPSVVLLARRTASPLHATPWSEPPALVALPVDAPAESATARPSTVRSAVGHALLLAAGLAQMDLPPALAAYLRAAAPPHPGVPAAAPLLASLPPPAPAATGSRWSADGWLMLREDGGAPVVSGRPRYGRSQAGAVLRYRLAPSRGLDPQAYLRLGSAVAGPREQDLAAGLSARPLPGVPVRVAAESRVSRTDSGTELRPAALALTELPPVALPHGLRAEAYLQGGYVGGRFATAFVDGQGRVDRPVAMLGQAEVTAGAGIWGGAQKGSARLDIGPTAAVAFRLGDARGRLAADYRFRVAGDADPASGPALTLSAGF